MIDEHPGLPDGDVETFTLCRVGPDAGPLSPVCRCADLDEDGDADLAQFARYSGIAVRIAGQTLRFPIPPHWVERHKESWYNLARY